MFFFKKKKLLKKAIANYAISDYPELLLLSQF